MEQVRLWVGRYVNFGCTALVSLVLAATGHQIYASKTGSLTPWKGGGFGMYTAPHVSARAVFVILGDRPLRLAPESEALEAWIRTLDRESAVFLNGLVTRAEAVRNYPQDPIAAQVMADVARVHWPAALAGSGGIDGLFKRQQLRLVVTELARKPVLGTFEQRVIFTAGGQ